MAPWVRTRHAAGLSGRASTDTEPETTLRRALWRAGLRYRLHPPLGERLKADFLLLPSRVCVFVDGCFWHQCPYHKPKPKSGPNVELWHAKFERTRKRDQRAIRLANALGYRAIRVWECQVADDAQAVAARIRKMAIRRVMPATAALQEAVSAS